MNLATAKKRFPVLRKTILVFLCRPEEVLLGMKKVRFGAGKWNGAGGKVEAGETTEMAAVRETEEELLVTPKSLQLMARCRFYFVTSPPGKVLDQEVSVFISNQWEGDHLWLARVLGGEQLEGEFLFEGDRLKEYKLLPFTKE